MRIFTSPGVESLLRWAQVVLVEINALIGSRGVLKRPLETNGAVITAGFGLWAIRYAFGEIVLS